MFCLFLKLILAQYLPEGNEDKSIVLIMAKPQPAINPERVIAGG